MLEQPTPSQEPQQTQPIAPGAGQPPAPVATPPANYTDGWGIASIILAAMSLSLPGFVVGLIGASKAKKIGAPPVLSRIGWIVNLTVMAIGLLVGLLILWYALSHPDEIRKYIHEAQQQSTEQHY